MHSFMLGTRLSKLSLLLLLLSSLLQPETDGVRERERMKESRSRREGGAGAGHSVEVTRAERSRWGGGEGGDASSWIIQTCSSRILPSPAGDDMGG